MWSLLRPSIILCYHRLGDEELGSPSLLSTSPENFLSHLALLRRMSYTFVPLEDFDASVPATCAITFDDGYSDNLTNLAPLLVEQKVPVTIFISSHYVETGQRFPPDLICKDVKDPANPAPSRDERLMGLVSLPKQRFLETLKQLHDTASGCSDGTPLTLSELKILSKIEGVEIGPHTVTHRSMTSLSDQELLHEITDSAAFLSRLGIKSSRFFALPFGQGDHVSASVSHAVRNAGFEPLTTFPITPVRADKCHVGQLGLPRLSVGPWDVRRFRFTLYLMFLGSLWPAVWLGLLETRRRLRGARSQG